MGYHTRNKDTVAQFMAARRKYLLVDGQEVLEEVWFTADEYEEAQVKVRECTGGNLHYCPAD